jgi:phosphoribosylformylglycinamidine synthase subunit PurSL
MAKYLLDVFCKDQKFDATGNGLAPAIKEDLFIKGVEQVSYVDSYIINLDIDELAMKELAENIFIDPIIQGFSLNNPYGPKGLWFAEVHFNPDVTDNVAITSSEVVEDFLKRPLNENEKISFVRKYLFKGKLSEEDIKKICTGMLANDIIEKFNYGKIE